MNVYQPVINQLLSTDSFKTEKEALEAAEKMRVLFPFFKFETVLDKENHKFYVWGVLSIKTCPNCGKKLF